MSHKMVVALDTARTVDMDTAWTVDVDTARKVDMVDINWTVDSAKRSGPPSCYSLAIVINVFFLAVA